MRAERTVRLRDDRGSVLLLTIGFLVIVVMGIGVVVDASAVFLQRRSLAALADGAALAGAQTVDREAYYRGGARAALRPTARQVRAEVTHYLRTAPTAVAGARLERIDIEGTTVIVALRATARAPFTGWLRIDFPIRVEAGARLLLQ